MSGPERTSPFGSQLAPGHHGAAGEGVALREIQRDALELSVSPNGEAVLYAAFATKHGLELPSIGRWVEAEGVAVFAFQPRVWQVMAAPGTLDSGAALAPETSVAMVETGNGLGMIEISGPRARGALAKLCRLDLHPRAFRAGDCARTIMAQIPVQLWQIDEKPAYGLAVPVTFAHSFLHALISASEQFGCIILDKDLRR